jgi:transposase
MSRSGPTIPSPYELSVLFGTFENEVGSRVWRLEERQMREREMRKRRERETRKRKRKRRKRETRKRKRKRRERKRRKRRRRTILLIPYVLPIDPLSSCHHHYVPTPLCILLPLDDTAIL